MKKSLLLMAFAVCISLALLLPVSINAQDEEARAQLDRATSLLARDKVDEAIDQFLKIIEKHPNYGLAYSNLGAAYYRKGNLDKASEATKKAIEINPNDKSAHGNLGNVYTDLKKYDEAIAEHKKAIELSPNDAEAFLNLGVAFSRKGDTEEGVIQFKRAISLNRNYPAARKNLAYSYYLMKKWPEAIDELLLVRDMDPWYPGAEELLTVTLKQAYPDFEKWVDEKPKDPLSHYYLGYALAYGRKWKKAIEEMDKAIKLDRSKGEFYRSKALFCSSAKKPKEAVTALKECIAVNPSNWACYNDLSAEYGGMGKPKEALAVMTEAIARSDIAPNVVSIQANLGAVYATNGEYQKAIAPLQKALALCRRHEPLIELNLAAVSFELKQYDMAWRHVRSAERMGHPDARKLIKDLKKVSKEPE